MTIRKCGDLPNEGYWHVTVFVRGSWGWIQKYNMNKEELLVAIVNPYRRWEEISVHGNRINRQDISQIKISHTNAPADSFNDVMNGNFRLYKNLFDGVPNSDDYNTLVTRDGLDTFFVSPIEYEERLAIAKTKAKISVIQNQIQDQKQEQSQTTNIVLDNYESLNQFTEQYANFIKQIKQKKLSPDLLLEAKEAQDSLDSISKNSDKSSVIRALRRVKRVIGNLKDISVDVKEIISSLKVLSHLFGL